MDFKSLGENAPVHVVRKKPFLYEVGVLKSKSGLPQQMQQTNPYLAQLMQQNMPQQSFNIVVTVNGKDEVVQGIPLNGENVDYNNTYYCATSEGAIQAIANMMQMASAGKADVPYYDSILVNGEKYMEMLNPQYAAGKQQARTIEELQKRQVEQDQKMDRVLSMMERMMGGTLPQGSEPAKK